MNSDDLEQKLAQLTASLTERQKDLSAENLQDYLEDVASSLTQVFALAEEQIDKGLRQIELAADCLQEQDLVPVAETFVPLLKQVRQAKDQLELGRKVAGQTRSLEIQSEEICSKDLLTGNLRQTLERVERIIGEVSSF